MCVLRDLRVRGRKVADVIELGGPREAAMFAGLSAELKQLQDRLGVVLDHATAKTLFTKWTEQTPCRQERAQLSEAAAIEDVQIQKSFQRFRDWCSCERIQHLRRQVEQAVGR